MFIIEVAGMVLVVFAATMLEDEIGIVVFFTLVIGVVLIIVVLKPAKVV